MSILNNQFMSSVVNKVIRIIVGLPLILSASKSFQDNPILGSRFLNICGLHVIRVLVSALIFRFRQIFFLHLVAKTDRDHYMDQGFIMKEAFLPDEMFNQLVDEVTKYYGEFRECKQSDALTKRVMLRGKLLNQTKVFKQLVSYKPLRRLLSYASGRLERPMTYS